MLRRIAITYVPVAAIAIAAASLALIKSPSRSATRVALRVDCTSCALPEALALDVWSEQLGPNLPLDIVVSDRSLPILDAAHVSYQVLVPDIDAVARDEAQRLRHPTIAALADWFGEYRDYAAIGTHLHELAALAPERAQVQSIGGSVEGRPLWALRIGHGDTHMLIDATEHAREWLAAMATTCVADRLVRDYDRDPAIRDFVDHTSLWVVPVVNPDGYQYAWGVDRYWRKNRRGSYGVDLNRNFAVGWGDGSSGNERAETYRGERPFSEPESTALRDLAKREHVALHIDFHTFSQLVLYPWNYKSTPAPDRDWFAATGDRIASAIYAAHRERYRLIQGIELYPAGGTTSDWMYGDANAKSFTIELRPTPRGRSGFVQPPEQIRPTCDEALAAVLALRSAKR
ncbi:MAG TPA: M14 family zinc carboxypeptidase [Kofleriaceae bacterium]